MKKNTGTVKYTRVGKGKKKRSTYGLVHWVSLLIVLSALVITLMSLHSSQTLFGHAASACHINTPGVSIDNNYGWGSPGSWGMPGQQLKYAIHVINYDVGCTTANFIVTLTTPNGFTLSFPTNTVTLKSSSSSYLWAYVISPSGIADGDYPIIATVQRVGDTTLSAPYTIYYKVYSSDTQVPTLFWPNPGDGGTITSSKKGNYYNVQVSSNDDHAVKKIDLYIDNVYISTAQCDDISYTCQLVYKWSLRGVTGQHSATFKSYDWVGNVGTLTANFTVN